MRFSTFFALFFAALTFSQAASVDHLRVRAPLPPNTTPKNDLVRRQAVQSNICATVGPLTLVGITVVSKICLCTQAGVLTPKSVADLQAAITVAKNGGLLNTLVNVLGYTVSSILNALLPTATSDVNNSGGQCTTPIPTNAYPVCTSANAAPGSCSFACNSDFATCGTGCIASTQVCPSAAIARRSQQTVRTCATGWTACPVEIGKSVVYECINVERDLESCGGCSGLRTDGVDCTSLPGVNDIACIAGQCQASSCLRGFMLNGTSCLERSTFKPRRVHLA